MSTKLELDVAKMQENIKAICDAIHEIKEEISELRSEIRRNYVTQDQFDPIKRFVQGMQGALAVVLLALLGLVLSHVIPQFRL